MGFGIRDSGFDYHHYVTVLFLCTGNSARSILAEAILNAAPAARGRFKAFSAGSHPSGAVHALALELLRERGIPVDGLRSKSWDEFAAPRAPAIDIVVTVCDAAAAETCPVWPGRPAAAHWGLPDPAARRGSPADQRGAFEQTADLLQRRIERLLALPIDTLDRDALLRALRKIGDLHGPQSHRVTETN